MELYAAGAAPFYARAGDVPVIALLLGVVGAAIVAARRSRVVTKSASGRS